MISWPDFVFDEILTCNIKNNYDALCEIAGIFSGLDEKFLTRRIILARRVLKLWDVSGLNKNKSYKIKIIRCVKNKKSILKFNITNQELFFNEIMNFADSVNFSWDFLRGLFASCGNLYLPKSGYYLNLKPHNFFIAQKFIKLSNLHWHQSKNFNLNLRRQEDIVTFMANIGLSSTALKLEDRAILNEIKNNANRLNNFEAANIKRSIKSAAEQLENVKYIIESGLLNDLPDNKNIQEFIKLRIEYPDLNLKELGEKFKVPLKNYAVKYLYSKIKNFIKFDRRGKSQ